MKDTTPPPAPTNVKAVAGELGVLLTWSATADIESGLKQIVVYKNGEKIATIGDEKPKANGMGFVQAWNYGDEPVPKSPDFLVKDRNGKAGDKYEVVAVNHAGLESKKSETANAK